MPTILTIILIVYLVAINFYGVLLLLSQKNERDKYLNSHKISDGKLVLIGFLGGALGIFSFMLILKYRLGSFWLMVLLPVMISVTAYLSYLAFSGGFVMILP